MHRIGWRTHYNLAILQATGKACSAQQGGQGQNMKVTLEHHRTKKEVMESVDRSFGDMFKGVEGLPVKVAVKQKSWQGSTLNFALTAKMGLLSTPITGTVEVTDTELIIDADLGMLNRFISDETAQQMLGHKIKGLLN
jgi:hypothetical protein